MKTDKPLCQRLVGHLAGSLDAISGQESPQTQEVPTVSIECVLREAPLGPTPIEVSVDCVVHYSSFWRFIQVSTASTNASATVCWK